ncbi:tyrosine-type recombinase/integrase [Pseudomonas aeruginosa]|uniref:tyrosine-type recombinase/integrase n=1 Tax=Pseudomonas aeruginosa TaxID=287 RepID=UPI000F52CAED|nr:tyrosine-type recombinase/integrase [Pseudomonas aeruginosa]RQI39291.1 integrase [Pseudomonas aeruginosa]
MRPRKKDRHLPMCMFQRGPSFYFVRDGKWTNLGRDYRAALLEYAKLTGGASEDGMIDLIDRVMDHIAPYRSANTITQYRAVAERLKDMFAEFQPREVLPKHVAQVKTHMASTPNMANRTLTVLRVVFAQALEWGEVDSNPCIGIKPHSEKKRGRYLNDKELLSILDNCSEYMRCIFELAYLTGQRIGDVLSIKLDDVSDDGIAFQQQKTGSKVLISMTPDLDAVVQRAKALPRPADAKNLICNRKGKQVDYATTRDAWKRAREAAGVTDARIHDLRAKALTDAKKQGKDARKLGGHTDPRMTDRYIRQREHEVAEPPTMPRKSG